MTASLIAPTTAQPTTAQPTTPQPTRAAAEPGPSRAGLYALVAGAALNTFQAVLYRTIRSDDPTAAGRLADVDAHPALMLTMILAGMAGVVLLVVGLQHVARLVRPYAPRTARIGSVLTFAGTLGFFGMHALMLAKYALTGMEDRAVALAAMEHLDSAPLLMIFVVPFLVGMFGGAATLTVGLFRSAGVPRWVPACWALFLPLDFFAAGAGVVDPHWLFLAGAVGVALAGGSAAAKR